MKKQKIKGMRAKNYIEGRARISIQKNVLRALNEICIEKNKTLDGLFKRLVLYSGMAEQILTFPDEINQSMIIDVQTVTQKIPLWMSNVRENFAAIKGGKDIKDISVVENTPALIIGAGPSLHKNKHLELLAETGFKGNIFATDAILKDCLEYGIVPDYVLFVDASDKIYHFIDHDIVDKYADKLTAIMCITTHPSVVKRWKGDIYWFNTVMEEFYAPNVGHILQLLTHGTILSTGGHCAGLGWTFAILRRHNPIVLIGTDLSYTTDFPIEETSLYAIYLNALKGNKKEVLKVFDNHYHHNFFNTDCYFDRVFEHYTNIAKAQFKLALEQGVKIINCTEGGTLEGENIECMYFKDYLDANQR